jgi:hypothetical protein
MPANAGIHDFFLKTNAYRNTNRRDNVKLDPIPTSTPPTTAITG